MPCVHINKHANKQLKKAPLHIKAKLKDWILAIELNGLEDTRKIPGFHDEPLQGQRLGQRSIRLNKQWRLIYEETEAGIQITILEVTPHDYRIR